MENVRSLMAKALASAVRLGICEGVQPLMQAYFVVAWQP